MVEIVERFAILDAKHNVCGIFFDRESDAQDFIEIYGSSFSYQKMQFVDFKSIDECLNESGLTPKIKIEKAYPIKRYRYTTDYYERTGIYFSDIGEAEKFADMFGDCQVGKKEYVRREKIYSSIDEFINDKDKSRVAKQIYKDYIDYQNSI